MTRAYTLPWPERARLHGRAYRAQQKDQLEVCGVLLANADRELRLQFLVNGTDAPGKWSIGMTDGAAVRRAVAGSAWRIVGTFHSHPVSYAVPGATDFASLRMHQLQLIYDVCGRQARLWTRRSTADDAVPVEVPLGTPSRRREHRPETAK